MTDKRLARVLGWLKDNEWDEGRCLECEGLKPDYWRQLHPANICHQGECVNGHAKGCVKAEAIQLLRTLK